MEFESVKNLFSCFFGKVGLCGTVLMPAVNYNLMPSRIKVLSVLHHLDCTDPKKRSLNAYDRKFIKLIPVLHRYDDALSFLNTYGHVSDTYFEYLTGAENNAYLQMRLCSIDYSEYGERYYAKYSNLVCYFLRKWDFRPEVKAKIFKDNKYGHVADIYRLIRKN